MSLAKELTVVSEVPVGDKVFAFIKDPSGIEFVSGPFLPVSTARKEKKAKEVLERLLISDHIFFGDQVFGVIAGYQIVLRALAEGLIVENQLTPFPHPHKSNLSKGRILLNGRLWHFFASSAEFVFPPLKAATVDYELNILQY